ncbi:hypothetical protein AMTRI_Chr07g80220 [Amborella trichopoda]
MVEVAKGLEKLISNGVNSKYLTEKYILPLEERPKFSSDESLSESIPVIVLSRVSDRLGRQNIIWQITKASEDYGFFQIMNHGVPEDVIQEMLGVATEFFEMPIEERAKLYSEDPKTQVRVQLWRDFLRHPCHPLEDYIDSWPQMPENYRYLCLNLLESLLALLSEGLGLGSGYLNEKFGKHNQIQLINYYPPCPDPNLTLGLPGHSDPNGITVFLQDEVGGLQVLKDGKWIIVKAEKNAFVVLSNGRFKSVEHRAIANSTSSRVSLPTFYVSKESPAIYRSYTFGEFFDRGILPPIFKKVSKIFEFYKLKIINHGVPKEVIQDMLGVTTEFFEMPIEERKKLYSKDPKTQVRVCTSFNFQSKVQFWRDFLRHPCHPLEDYREVASKYALEIKALTLKLLALLSEGFGLDSGYLNEKFGKHNQIQLINYYPPCPDPILTLGLPGHSDSNGITVTLQDEVGGLQVLKDGKWIIVKPEKNAFVVNIANNLQVISNGRFKSVEHSAITNSTSSRISLPTFYGPSLDASIGPANELLNKESPAIYRSYTFGEFFDRFCLSSAAMAEVAKGLEKLISNGANSKYLTEKYILPLEERPKSSSDESLSESIPVIDLSRVSDCLGQQNIILQISKASEGYGFFQTKSISTKYRYWPGFPPKTPLYICFFVCFQAYLTHKYALEIRALILKLLALLSEGLGLDSGYLNEKFGKHNQIQLINYYPPCPNPNQTLGLQGHSDLNGITVLLHDEEGELQVLKDGKWIIVKPEKNSFVVITHGWFKSVEQRAIMNSTSSRISLPKFYGPSLVALIGPANELVSNESPAIYRSYTFWEFFDRFFSQELKGKTVLDHFKYCVE